MNIFGIMKLIEQIQKGESKTLEFKRALPKNENIAKVYPVTLPLRIFLTDVAKRETGS